MAPGTKHISIKTDEKTENVKSLQGQIRISSCNGELSQQCLPTLNER